jgi:hypothetical protein
MNVSNFFVIIFKIGLGLLLTGKLAQVTFNYAVSVALEEQSGLISLGKLSREIERPYRHR